MQTYNLSAIEEVADGSEEFVKKMIASFLKNTPLETHNMLQAASADDFETTKKTAHKIKPSLEMMGAHDLVQINTAIELSSEQQNSQQVIQLINTFNTKFELLSRQLKQDYSLWLKINQLAFLSSVNKKLKISSEIHMQLLDFKNYPPIFVTPF